MPRGTISITSLTKLNAVIGYPLEHSLSPILHTSAYEFLGMDAVMLAFPCANISSLVQTVRTLPIQLTAVTIPHKESVMPHLDMIDTQAKEIGSINTIVNKGGVLHGYNTDIIGIQEALGAISLAGKRVLLLGAGGVARPVAFVVREAHGSLFVYNRSRGNAEKIVHDFGGTILADSGLRNTVFDIIINATPVGMHPRREETPLPHYDFNSRQVVFDCVYSPKKTKLLRDAADRGAHTISGVEMFLSQALAQIALWTQTPVPSSVKNKLKKIIMQRMI